MKRIFLGLTLFAVSAWCTPIPASVMVNLTPIPFTTYMTLVTDPNTPEWARLTDVFAWWELQLGSFTGGSSPMNAVLRGLLRNTQGNYTIVQWLEFVPVMNGILETAPLDTSTPEPGALLLAASALAGLYWRRVRSRSADR